MRHDLLLTFLLVCAFTESIGQTNTFQKAYDLSATCNAMQITYDGGFVMAGTTLEYDISLFKTDGNGNFLWAKTYGDSLYDHAQSVIETNDHGFLIAGATTSFGLGKSDAYFIKTDQSGNLTWSKTYGQQSWQGATSVQQTSDGGYIAVGYHSSSQHDIYAFKTDSLGNLQWSKLFGGGDYDDGYSVVQTPDGGYLIAGDTYSFGVAVGFMDGLLIKLDSAGTMMWSKTYGGTGNESITCIKPVKTGGYIMAGYTNELGFSDDYVVRIDESGSVLWSAKYGTSDWERSTSIVETSDGGFIISGISAASFGILEDGHLVRIDNSGNFLWARRYDRSANDNFRSVHQSANDDFIVAGNTLMQMDTSQVNNVYLLHLDASGNAGCAQIPFDTVASYFGTTITTPYPGKAITSGSIVAATIVKNSTAPVSTICLDGLGLEERISELHEIRLYPNPATHFLTIQSSLLMTELSITNSLGHQVVSRVLNNTLTTVDISTLSAGIYFYSAKTTQGNRVGKILVR